MNKVIRVNEEDKDLNKCFRAIVRRKHLTIEAIVQEETEEFGYSLLMGE